MLEQLPGAVQRAAYRMQQTSILLPCLLAQRAARLVAGLDVKEPPPGAVERFRRRYYGLLQHDLANAEAGLYPRSLLFQIPLADYAKTLPRLFGEIPRAARRARAGDYQDLPRDVPLEHYPAYFRRTFHWQTDGYLSKRSAELYDMGVEFLFMGTADIMRRQVIPPMTRFLAGVKQPRILDVACGTGRTLGQLAVAQPAAKCFGMDLSPYYLQVAREQLADVPDVSFVADNAERMPFRDDSFDVVTSTFLFHELPRNARRSVYAEMMRVLRPGGLLVIEDSAQLSEGGDLAVLFTQFAADFHEPFHADYVKDDIATALSAAGFVVESTEPCFLAKVVVARRPERSAQAA